MCCRGTFKFVRVQQSGEGKCSEGATSIRNWSMLAYGNGKIEHHSIFNSNRIRRIAIVKSSRGELKGPSNPPMGGIESSKMKLAAEKRIGSIIGAPGNIENMRG